MHHGAHVGSASMMTVAMHRLLALSSASLLFPQLSYASVLFDGRYNVGLGFDSTGLSSLEPRAGYEAFVGLQAPPALILSKRDCLPNGSNYCFGNNVKYCSDCGTCCVKGQFCCPKGRICCGTGCCDSGYTCSQNGKCVAPVVLRNAVTDISTIYETSTYTNQKKATVVVVEVETSTIFSTVETTVSNAATQTDVYWVTTTVTAAASSQAAVGRRADAGRSLLDSLILRGVEFFRNGAVLQQRQAASDSVASQTTAAAVSAARASTVAASTVATPTVAVSSVPRPSIARPTATALTVAVSTTAASTSPAPTTPAPVPTAAASTVVKYTTQISTVTEVNVNSVTITSTSHVMTTIYQTATKVLNALTTVLVTSTLTVTSHPPITQVITTTVDPIIPVAAPTASTTSSAASEGSAQLPSTPAIIGIAVGTAAVFILFVLLTFLLRRRRMRKNAIATSPPSTPEHMLFHQPTLPKVDPLAHFKLSAPEHHATAAYLPAGYPSPSPSKAFVFGHERNSSGFSTLVGKPGDRRSGFSTTSDPATFDKLPPVRMVSPVEFPGSPGQIFSEADGKPVTVVTTTTTERVRRHPSPFPELPSSAAAAAGYPPPPGQASDFTARQSPSQILEQAITAHATMPLGTTSQLGRSRNFPLGQIEEQRGRDRTPRVQQWQQEGGGHPLGQNPSLYEPSPHRTVLGPTVYQGQGLGVGFGLGGEQGRPSTSRRQEHEVGRHSGEGSSQQERHRENREQSQNQGQRQEQRFQIQAQDQGPLQHQLQGQAEHQGQGQPQQQGEGQAPQQQQQQEQQLPDGQDQAQRQDQGQNQGQGQGQAQAQQGHGQGHAQQGQQQQSNFQEPYFYPG